MKWLLFATVISLFLYSLITGCSRSKGGSPAATMKALINGNSFSTTGCLYSATPNSTGTNQDVLFIWGKDTGSVIKYPYIQITIYNYAGVGSYTIGSPLTNIALYDSTSTSGSASKYGVVTVTAVAPLVIGTFSFTCYDSTKVTEGTFVATME